MGFRFRKSKSLFGGAVRINFSKSGIGYSYGGKGARVTKMSNGRTRTTLSAPGTGISYVTESGGTKRKSNQRYNTQQQITKESRIISCFILVGIVLFIIGCCIIGFLPTLLCFLGMGLLYAIYKIIRICTTNEDGGETNE